jgi:hypothetical protein
MSSPPKRPEDVGSFATGEEDPERYPEDRDIGTFAEEPGVQPDEEVGTFATGEADPKAHPEDTERGSFATGEEEE